MEFRVIKADYKSKYDYYFNGRKKDIRYYIVQYKKDPSFFGLIKHDWQTAEYNAEQLAKSSLYNEITIGCAQSCYNDKDILVPGFDKAMELLRLIKKKLGVDCGPRNGIVVYEELHKDEKSSIDHNALARSYDELIEK